MVGKQAPPGTHGLGCILKRSGEPAWKKAAVIPPTVSGGGQLGWDAGSLTFLGSSGQRKSLQDCSQHVAFSQNDILKGVYPTDGLTDRIA